MKCMAWNCNGLGNPGTIRGLLKLLRKEGLEVIFLCETILKVNKLDAISRRCGFDGVVGVDANGKSGDLALLWSDEIKFDLKSVSKFHIDGVVKNKQNSEWRVTGFYGEPDTNLRSQAWSMMQRIGDNNQLPWLMMGDFNELLWQSKKKGGGLRPERLMKAFGDTLDEMNLADLGFIGPKFTWKRGKSRRTVVQERLDRAVANKE